MLKKPAIFATSVLDAASFIGGSLSPCEIVTVFGHWIGPKQLALFELDAQNEFPTLLGRARLFINGVAQRLIFASKEQLAAIVDCRLEPGGSSSPAQIQGAQVWVEFDGQQSNIVELPVSPTAPALFTTAQSGQGKTATLNQDGSVNSAANPAELGSTVVLFGTGQGVTEPFCDSAGLASTTELMPTVAQFAATVAGQPAALLFSGASPGLTCGLGQWNVTIPAALTEADANQDPTATTI